jgi:hypothetical protein
VSYHRPQSRRKRYKTFGFSLLIRAALGLRLRESGPATFVSTIILKMRAANETGLALQSFRNSAKRAGRIDTNTVRGHGTTALDLEWRLADGLPQELKLLGCSEI